MVSLTLTIILACEAKPSDRGDAAKTSQANLTRVIWERGGPALPLNNPPFLHILEPGTGYHHIVECIRASGLDFVVISLYCLIKLKLDDDRLYFSNKLFFAAVLAVVHLFAF